MLRSSVYVLGGVVAGVALTENKEAVGDVLFNVGTFVKSFATELRNVKVSGTTLGDVWGLRQTLDYVSSMELKRESLQIGVNQASTALTDAVRRNDASKSASPSSSSSTSSYLTLGLMLAVPASIYLYTDDAARRQALSYTQQALSQAKKAVESMQAAAQDEATRKQLLNKLQKDVKNAQEVAASYYTQGRGVAQEQLGKLLRLIQEQLGKAGVNKDSAAFKLFDS